MAAENLQGKALTVVIRMHEDFGPATSSYALLRTNPPLHLCAVRQWHRVDDLGVHQTSHQPICR